MVLWFLYYPKNQYKKSYFEAARRSWNRSLLSVNEDFSDKADAEIAFLDDFYLVL